MCSTRVGTCLIIERQAMFVTKNALAYCDLDPKSFVATAPDRTTHFLMGLHSAEMFCTQLDRSDRVTLTIDY